MNNLIFACAILLAFFSAASSASGAPVPDRAPSIIPPSTAAAPSEVAPAKPADWIESISSKTLTAVDGSTLTLTSTEAGVARHMVSASGDAQDTGFTFLNRNIGTVNEASDTVGVFRRDGDTLAITYEDGRTETIAATADGGVTMTLHAPDNTSHCMGWYPQGHTFNDAEKRAALALYAKKLGLPSNGALLDSCVPATQSAAEKIEPVTPIAAAPVPTLKHHAKRSASLTPATSTAMVSAPPLTEVSVRDSEVHAVNDGGEMLASMTADPGHGASTCLSVDSDGAHWGFRNSCRFDVEFAYCLKNAGTDIASCDKGPASGLVAAGGFTPLIRSSALGGNDAEHQFRWVGCGLVGTPLEAHLEQTSPPAGRCLAPSAS